jgi:hypothetical protein
MFFLHARTVVGYTRNFITSNPAGDFQCWPGYQLKRSATLRLEYAQQR